MKTKERKRARELRLKGWSIKDIYTELGVGKGSVSVWVRDIELTVEQTSKLSKRSHSREVEERRRITRLTRENARRQVVVDQAKAEITDISNQALFFIGISLYWAEGSKTRRGIVELTNADPALIQVGMQFFRKICRVPEEKFRGHVILHPHLEKERAEGYWSTVSGISTSQFFKTSMQQSRASKKKRDTLPYGTFAIVICDTTLFLRIKGWTEGLHGTLLSNDPVLTAARSIYQ